MNRVVPSVPPSEDLDTLLGTFFKGEMPAVWPALKPPVRARPLTFQRRPDPPRSRLVFRSRLALAASVALLMFTAWLLGGRFSTSNGVLLPVLRDNKGDADKNMRFPVVPVSPNRPEIKPDLPVLPKLEPVPVETIELDKDGRASLKMTLPRNNPNE